MAPLSDSEFSAKFFACSTALEKIRLAIKEERFSFWFRPNNPNLPEEYLVDILGLPANHAVRAKPRKSGDEGLPQVYEMVYPYEQMGISVSIYFKGYFEIEGGLVMELKIQSLRKDE